MPIARRLHDHLPVQATEIAGVDSIEMGDRLFEAMRAAIAAGYEPERLLLDAAKRAIPAPESETTKTTAQTA